MKTQSAKAKGRKLQQLVRDKLIEMLDIHPEDVKSTSMGAGGEDVTMSSSARKKFPCSIECKNVEKLNFWNAYDQAIANANGFEPIVVAKKNKHKPLVLCDLDYFINLHKPGVKMYDNYEKILNRVRGIVKQTVAESNQAKVLAELNDLEFEIAETISGRLEQMSADEQD